MTLRESILNDIVKDFILEMLPHDGAVGVDIDSAAFEDMLAEYTIRYPQLTRHSLRQMVLQKLRYLGEHGFSDLT